MKSTKAAYYHQQRHAKDRGIEWSITYEEWLRWWGDDLPLRGRGYGKLQMCRYNDAGPYHIGNIYKATHECNSRDKFHFGFKGKKAYLTDEQVLQIKQLLTEHSTRRVAQLVGTNQKTVMRVKHGVYPTQIERNTQCP